MSTIRVKTKGGDFLVSSCCAVHVQIFMEESLDLPERASVPHTRASGGEEPAPFPCGSLSRPLLGVSLPLSASQPPSVL